jgi:4-oxalocrotonate tautomerase
MPHVIVKLWPGKTEAQKRGLADAITADVMKVALREESVSVAFEEVDATDWAKQAISRTSWIRLTRCTSSRAT